MKPFWESKTMIFNFITLACGAAAIAFPHANINIVPEFITNHAAQITMIWGIIGMTLRSVTKDAIVLGD